MWRKRRNKTWREDERERGLSSRLSSQSQVTFGFRSVSKKWSAEPAIRTLLMPSRVIAPDPRR